MLTFLELAVKEVPHETKLKCFELFQSLNSLDEQCWKLAVQLLIQLKSEKIFSTTPPCQSAREMVAEGAIGLIQDPVNNTERITSLLKWRGEHEIQDSPKFLLLLASSKLLTEALTRLKSAFQNHPDQFKEHLPVLEQLLKNFPATLDSELRPSSQASLSTSWITKHACCCRALFCRAKGGVVA